MNGHVGRQRCVSVEKGGRIRAACAGGTKGEACQERGQNEGGCPLPQVFLEQGAGRGGKPEHRRAGAEECERRIE